MSTFLFVAAALAAGCVLALAATLVVGSMLRSGERWWDGE